MTMRVTVKAFGELRRLLGGEKLELDLPAGACVADALRAAGLPDVVDVWALLDGSRAGRAEPLREGAEVSFFQPVGGGC